MDDLATHANCSNSTIRDFEAHRRQPHKNRLTAIRQALEIAGMIFYEEPAKGTAGVSGPVEAIAKEAKKKPPGRVRRSSGNARKGRVRAA
jgi:hypothetical protein